MTLRKAGVSYRLRGGILRHKRVWALRGIDLELNRGETLGVVGRNGSGKSTILQLIAGITAVDEGEIKRKKASAALLALKLGFIGHLTGRQNAILSGLLLGMRKTEIVAKLQDIAEFSGLEDFFDEPLYSYSNGMKMRLGFAASYQFKPDILLLDEVLGVGDASFKKRSAQVMRERIRSNATVVMVSHNAERIRQLADRTLWLDKGSVVRVGETASVIDEYEEFVDKLRKNKNLRLRREE